MVCRIYALMSGQLVLYVGKTKTTLRDREINHRSKSNTSYSKYIPEYTDWVMTLLEECTEECGTERELYYYNILKPLYNHRMPGRTKREWWADNRERYRERHNENQRKWKAKQKLAASVSSDTHIVSDTPISPS